MPGAEPPSVENSNAHGESSAPRVDATEAPGAVRRLHLDWRTFAYLVAAMLAAAALLGTFRGASTMITRIALGVVIALAFDPLADSVQRRFQASRAVAVSVVVVGMVGIGALLVLVLGPRAVEEAQAFEEQLPATIAELERLPLIGERLADADITSQFQHWLAGLPERLTNDRVVDAAGSVVSGVAGVVIVVVVAVAVLIDGEYLIGLVRRLLPERRRAQGDEIGRVLYDTLGRYFGGSVTVAAMMGLYVLAIGLVLGVPLVPLAAVWAMLTDLIPQVGGFLGGSLFVVLALTEGVPTALAAGVLFVLYMNLENHVIQPAIVGRSVDLTAPTTMVAAFVGGAVAGVPGALVATPLVGTVKALYLIARGTPHEPAERTGLVRLVTARVRGLRHRQG
ncbi:MAG: AI-2E family transporter [Desertimonas sp.]